ncbi:MAG TPA: Gldg family protein, partial [Longimicrobiales bacterium]|nr:Gldg family protein [Longimicrobiales bacterium]
SLVFATGFGARSPTDVQQLSQLLRDRYRVSTADLSADTVPGLSPDTIDLLAVVGPTETLSEDAVTAIRRYLDEGGAGLFLLDRIAVDPRAPVSQGVETGLEPLLEERGVRLGAEVVADYQSNQTVSMGRRGIFSIVQPYPLWPVALPARDHPVTRNLESLTLAWASPVEIVDSTRAVPLWTTSEYGDRLPPGGTISPDAIPEPEPGALSTQILAAAVDPGPAAGGGDGDDGDGTGGARGRLVVVGDANFVEQQFGQGSPQNLTFAANAADWLAQDESLIAIRSKDRTPPPLVFTSDLQRVALRWGNLAGVPLIFVLLGLARGVQRRRQAERLWKEVQP